MPGILLKMELTSLPEHAGEASLASLLQSRVIVADDQLDAVQASFAEAVHKLAPVHLGLR
jgi:hypothetical protein